jgi:hypothetical protein
MVKNKDDFEHKIKYLEMVQNIIDRMGRNSFAIKNWFVVALSGILTLMFSQGKTDVLWAGICLSVFLWGLDAYYLNLERKYRIKYSDALIEKCALFDMDISKIKTDTPILKLMFSKSVSLYWVGIIILLISAYAETIKHMYNCLIICM